MPEKRSTLVALAAYCLTAMVVAGSAYLLVYGLSIGLAVTDLYRGMPAFWGSVALVLFGVGELAFVLTVSNRIGSAGPEMRQVWLRFAASCGPLCLVAALLVVAKSAAFAPAVGLSRVPAIWRLSDYLVFGVGAAGALGLRTLKTRLRPPPMPQL